MKGMKSLIAVVAVAGLMVGCQNRQQEPIRSTSNSGTSTAPSGQTAENRDVALVRFINAMPTMKTVSAFADSNRTFADVSYKTVTPYKEVPNGRHTFHLGGMGAGTMQAGRHGSNTESYNQGAADNTGTRGENNKNLEESESLSSGKYYTVLLRPSDKGTAPKMDVITDDFGTPSNDKARVRVIDAAVGSGKVDIYQRSKNDKLFSGIDVSSSNSYKEIDPVTTSLEVRPDGKKNALFTIPSMQFEAGKSYTIVLTGRGKGAKQLSAITVEDQFAQRPNSDQNNNENNSQGSESGKNEGSSSDNH